jgi:hypothetical protein
MATTIEQIEAGALAAIVSELQANQATVETWLGSGETQVQALLVNLIKQIPSISGPLSFVLGPIEAAFEAGIESYAASLIAKETPATLFALLIGLLTRLQAEV